MLVSIAADSFVRIVPDASRAYELLSCVNNAASSVS